MTIPRKRFAQHFLRDATVIQQLVTAISPTVGQHLVEIGPGRGALTLPLLKCGVQLDVVEIDRELIPQLNALGMIYPTLRIHLADALTFDFAQLKTDNYLRIIGNLPYNISTPLLFQLFNYLPCIQDMLFMLQREVVNRIVAEPATSEYGRLSVMVHYFCRVEKLFEVSADAFYPRPKVTSSVVRLIPHPMPPVFLEDKQHFTQIVQVAFAQRRKTLRNALRGWLSEKLILEQGIKPQRRAETLTLQEFADLANCYTKSQQDATN